MKISVQFGIVLIAVLASAGAFAYFSDGFDSVFYIEPANVTPQVNSVVTVNWAAVHEESGSLNCVANSTPTIVGWDGTLSGNQQQLTMPATPGTVTLQLNCADVTAFYRLAGSVQLSVTP